MAQAYFKCVNDNGGINGRPIDVRRSRPSRPIRARPPRQARKLIETEKVLGIVGNTSIIECDVNHEYYEQQGYLRDRLGHRARPATRRRTSRP